MFLSRSADPAQDGFAIVETGLLVEAGKGVGLFVGPEELLQQRELGTYERGGLFARLPRGSVRRRDAHRQPETLHLAPPLIGRGQHVAREQREFFNKEGASGKMQRQNMGYLL